MAQHDELEAGQPQLDEQLHLVLAVAIEALVKQRRGRGAAQHHKRLVPRGVHALDAARAALGHLLPRANVGARLAGGVVLGVEDRALLGADAFLERLKVGGHREARRRQRLAARQLVLVVPAAMPVALEVGHHHRTRRLAPLGQLRTDQRTQRARRPKVDIDHEVVRRAHARDALVAQPVDRVRLLAVGGAHRRPHPRQLAAEPAAGRTGVAQLSLLLGGPTCPHDAVGIGPSVDYHHWPSPPIADVREHPKPICRRVHHQRHVQRRRRVSRGRRPALRRLHEDRLVRRWSSSRRGLQASRCHDATGDCVGCGRRRPVQRGGSNAARRSSSAARRIGEITRGQICGSRFYPFNLLQARRLATVGRTAVVQ